MNAAIQHLAEGIDDDGARAGKALGERVGAKQNHAASHVFSQRFAHPCSVRAHQVDLELADGIRRNAQVGELAHAGVDGVGHAVVFDQVIDHGASAVDGEARLGLQQDGTPLVNDLPYIVEGQVVAVDVKCLQVLPAAFRNFGRYR